MKPFDDTFKQSVLLALAEERHDDLIFMIANKLRSRQQVVSIHARAALPVDKDLCQPLCTNRLTKTEIDTFDICDNGWHIIAVQNCRIIGAEPFPYTTNDPSYRDHMEDSVRSLSYHGDEPAVYGAYHLNGTLIDLQHLHEFRPVARQ